MPRIYKIEDKLKKVSEEELSSVNAVRKIKHNMIVNIFTLFTNGYVFHCPVKSNTFPINISKVQKLKFGATCEISFKDVLYSYRKEEFLVASKVLAMKTIPPNSIILTDLPLIRQPSVSNPKHSVIPVQINGLCNYDKSICIVSSSSLNSYDFECTIVHEYGHMIGLRHCKDTSCVMHSCSRMAPKFCDQCHAIVDKHKYDE